MGVLEKEEEVKEEEKAKEETNRLRVERRVFVGTIMSPFSGHPGDRQRCRTGN